MLESTGKIPLTLRCLRCSKETTQPLIWYASQDNPLCPFCDGDFDLEPLRELYRSLGEEVKALEKIAMLSNDTRH